MTVPDPAIPGTVRQHPDGTRTAIRTAMDNPLRAWFVYIEGRGGGYDNGAVCASWPVVSIPTGSA